MPDSANSQVHTDANARTSAMTLQKWGGLASFLLVMGFIVAPIIYLTGNLRDTIGELAYDFADFLSGPLWAASLVAAVFALRDYINERAPRRTSLALLAAVLAAGAMVLVACIRSANRHYHLDHPDLHLENSSTVLLVWATLVAGVTGAGLHFLGWALVLIGSAGWTSGHLPRGLCVLYLAGGIVSLVAYLFPNLEGAAALLGVFWSVWQGIFLWKSGLGETQTPQKIVSQS